MSRAVVRIPPVIFSRAGAPAERDGDIIRRHGIIFRSGVYPEKSYAMTPAELRALVADFRPVPIDAGHPSSASPLDGKLGQLESVELSEDGTTLFGRVALPRWLEETLGDTRRRVSPSFHRETKRLKSLSLVTHPHIEDAELQAAFACACGGHTEGQEEVATMPDDDLLARRKARAHEIVDEMDVDDLGIMTGEVELPEDDAEDPGDDLGGAEFSYDPDDDSTSAEFAAQQRRIEELEEKDRRRDAEVFIDAAIKENLVLPAERARLVARHAQFALDDLAYPAEFSDGKPLSRVKEFEADIKARRPHGYTRPADFGRALDGDDAPRPETPEEYAKRVNAKHLARDRARNGPA